MIFAREVLQRMPRALRAAARLLEKHDYAPADCWAAEALRREERAHTPEASYRLNALSYALDGAARLAEDPTE